MRFWAIIFILSLFFLQCTYKNLGHYPLADADMTIRLRWIPSFPNEKEVDVRTGLIWGLSMLGAKLPLSSMNKAFTSLESHYYLLNINDLGFSDAAKKAISPILKQLKESEEYKQKGGIDIGRFLVITLHSSWHYYAITDVPKTYKLFKDSHKFDSLHFFPVIQSSVANGNRVLRLPLVDTASDMAFIAEEGLGEWEKGTFAATDFEVFDVMPNGQLRFGIYDKKGDLLPASPAVLGLAGKPGKCMWCHESTIQPLFTPTPDPTNAMSAAVFQAIIKKMRSKLLLYQSLQISDADWKNDFAHTLQEWLYIGFMEPNLARIASEWNLPEAEVAKKIQHLSPHKHDEFAFFGDCYHRKDIDALSPYKIVAMPSSVRDSSDYEPNFVK